MDLSENVSRGGMEGNSNGEELCITMEDVQPEIELWNTTIVCYVLGMKHSYKIIN